MANLARARGKRVTYPLDDKVKAESYFSCGSSDHSAADVDDDVSPCLSELVSSFLEDGNEPSSPESCSPDDDGDNDYDSDAVECILRSSKNADPYAKVLFADVAEACASFLGRAADDKSLLQRSVMSFLRRKGHNAAICKTKWSSSGGSTAGQYEFIDVVATWQHQSKRYFVDVDFAAEFGIARPSSQYTRLCQTLPRHFVGGGDELKRIVRVMCDAAKRSLRSRELSVPPWRKNRYMKNKWFGPHKQTTVYDLPENRVALPLFSNAKCRWVGFDDVVSENNVVGIHVYIRT